MKFLFTTKVVVLFAVLLQLGYGRRGYRESPLIFPALSHMATQTSTELNHSNCHDFSSSSSWVSFVPSSALFRVARGGSSGSDSGKRSAKEILEEWKAKKRSSSSLSSSNKDKDAANSPNANDARELDISDVKASSGLNVTMEGGDSDIANVKEVRHENARSNHGSDPADFEEKTSELEKMGWEKGEAQDALRMNRFDIIQSASYLETAEETKELQDELVKELAIEGHWTDEAAKAALRECEWNMTEAESLLMEEEQSISKQFESSVADMVEKGWEEIVARQALLAQWTLDQVTLDSRYIIH